VIKHSIRHVKELSSTADYFLRSNNFITHVFIPDLILDFENAVAGFTLLRIYDVREWNKELIHIYEDGSFICNQT
jgi:hypothetical protein